MGCKENITYRDTKVRNGMFKLPPIGTFVYDEHTKKRNKI